jgi:hypothetical protein
MYTISPDFQPTMKMNIHNQCSDFKLKDKEYFSTGVNWNKRHDDEVDAGSMTSGDSIQLLATFGGVTIYELRRESVESDDQRESAYTLLFVAWKSEGYKKFYVFVQLIDCDQTFSWHKIDPKEYYQRFSDQLSIYTGSIEDTWLIHDSSVLMTRLELDFTQRDGVLNIIISEGIRNRRTKISEWIDSEM